MLSRHSVRRHQDNKLTRNVIFVDYDKQAFTVSCVLPVRRTIVSHLCGGIQASPHSKLSVIAAVLCGGLQANPHCKLRFIPSVHCVEDYKQALIVSLCVITSVYCLENCTPPSSPHCKRCVYPSVHCWRTTSKPSL